MTAEPLGYYDDDPMQEVFRLLAENDQASADESARLARQEELARAAVEAEAQSNATVLNVATRMAIQNVVDAAALARDGYDPSWDWRAQAAELGIDEYGNPLNAAQNDNDDEGKGTAPPDAPAPVGAHVPSRC
jgi:hypothetical protein